MNVRCTRLGKEVYSMLLFEQTLLFLRSHIHMDLQSEDKGEIVKMGFGRSSSFATDLNVVANQYVKAVHAFHFLKQGPDSLHSENLVQPMLLTLAFINMKYIA